MRTSKVITFYGHLGDDQLTTLAGKIAGAMENNSYFANPTPSSADLTAMVEDYRTKTEIAVNGGSLLDKRRKKASRLQLLKMLRALGHHVNTVADGNLPALTSTGMLLEKPHSTIEVPYVVENVALRDGNLSGQIRVDFSSQKTAREYELQVGEMDIATNTIMWGDMLLTTKSTNNIIAPLVPGRRHYIRVRARNGKGIGDWTEPVSLIAR